MSDLTERDACEIADLVRAREVGAVEVLEAHLARIGSSNAELNALVHVDADGARAAATDIDRRIASGDDPGPLAGVPIGIKDLEDVAGMPTTRGSIPYADDVPDRDGIQTERLRSSGAVIVGKTAAPEFGTTAHTSTPLHGTTRNPWNLERTPGGSSGGSAAAVAAGLLPLGSASDGGGSTRIPASYAGLVGFKGTYGRIPKGGGPDPSLTSLLGCLSRSVRDSARYWDCVVGADERDPQSLPHPGLSYEAILSEPTQGLRVAWSDDLGFGTCANEVATIARESADELVHATRMQWVDVDVELKDMSVAWGLFNRPGTWLAVRDFWPDRAEDFTGLVRATIRDADRYNMQELARAYERRHVNDLALAEVFDQADVIITPTTATTAFRAEGPMPSEIDGRPIKAMHAITFTYPFNVSGHPAVSLPAGFDAEGLPVGVQLVTRRHHDHVLFQLAAVLEQARPWPKLATAYANDRS